MIQQEEMKLGHWLETLRLRNAYYGGIFASRKNKVTGTLLSSPNANTWEENIYWHMGFHDGTKQPESTEPDQVEPDQVEPDQAEEDQVVPDQVVPDPTNESVNGEV
jgi:hypothetical protein